MQACCAQAYIDHSFTITAMQSNSISFEPPTPHLLVRHRDPFVCVWVDKVNRDVLQKVGRVEIWSACRALGTILLALHTPASCSERYMSVLSDVIAFYDPVSTHTLIDHKEHRRCRSLEGQDTRNLVFCRDKLLGHPTEC